MTNKFNVGDKVRILNANVLAGNRFNVSEGKEYEILSFHEKTDREVEHIKVADNHSNPFTICDWEYKYIERVIVELSEKQRISKLEEEVAELKLIVAQIRKPSTVVKEVLANDVIEFEGKQYKKVDREARGGDVVIFRENTNPENVLNNKTYKVISGFGETANFISELKTVYDVYHREMNRTRENVEVYESNVSFGTAVGQDLEAEYAEQVKKEKSPNQLRAEIIEKAKGFVESAISRGLDETELKGCAGNDTYKYHHYTVDFSTKNNKVISLVYRSNHVGIKMDKKPKHIGRAKCMPGDIYNEHIGKAIALGRALGLDVSEFEQAVQPNEVVIGMKVQYLNSKGVLKKDEGEICTVAPPGNYNDKGELAAIDSRFVEDSKIINDTNAIYEMSVPVGPAPVKEGF